MNSSPSPFPTKAPRIPCDNNWVVIHPFRCQGRAEASHRFLFLRYMPCSAPTSPRSRGQNNGRLCFSSHFSSTGGWVILSQRRTETSAASPHSRLCQLEMSLEWYKGSNAIFCVRQTGWVSLPVFSLPWLLKSCVDSQMLSHPLEFLSLLRGLITCRFIFLSQSDDFLYYNKLPSLSYSVTAAATFSGGIKNRVRQTAHAHQDQNIGGNKVLRGNLQGQKQHWNVQ